MGASDSLKRKLGDIVVVLSFFLLKPCSFFSCNSTFNSVKYTENSEYQRWASAILVRTSAIPHYCGQPKRLRNCGLKKLRNCDCAPSIFDFRNSLQSPASSATCPFSSAQDVFKTLESSISMETKNLP